MAKLITDLLLLNVTTSLHQTTWHKLTAHYANRISNIFIEHVGNTPERVIFQLCKTKEQAMARFNQSTFSTLRMTTQDEQQFTEWITAQKQSPVEWVTSLLGDGYKVSVSYVFEQNAFCLSVIGTDNSKHNKGIVMTTWSDDLEEVMTMAAYKHYGMCDGQEWPTQQNENRWG